MTLEISTRTAPVARGLSRTFTPLPFAQVGVSRTAEALSSIRNSTHMLIDDTTAHLNTHLDSIARFARAVEGVDADLEARLAP